MDVAQLAARHLAKVKVAGSRPAIHSQALVAECRRAGPRNLCPGRGVRVQIPPGVPGRVNQPGCWASLLTSARAPRAFDPLAFRVWRMSGWYEGHRWKQCRA